ncbi:MAG: hypothetical protein WC337_08370 [Candidatus Muiribacteriota bacterium]
MKKIAILFLIIISIAVMGRTFTTLAVGDYPGYKHDIDNQDGYYFKDYMERNGFKSLLFLEDEKVKTEHFFPAVMTDYLYFSGHGNKGFVALTDGVKDIYFYQKDLGLVKNIKHLIFASCMTVDTIDRWKESFGESLLSINGYKEESFDKTDNLVARYFAQNVGKINIEDSEDHVDAWMYANSSASYKMKDRWSSIGYSKENGRMYYWSQSRGDNRQSYNSESMVSFADGRISVLSNPSRMAIQSETIKTERENLLNVELFNKFQTRGIKDQSLNALKYDNGKENLLLFDSGAIIYQNFEKQTQRNISFNMEQNMQTAYEFVLRNGGIPEGFKTTSMDEILFTDSENENSEVWAYSITWEKSYNDKEVRGLSGDAINVIIRNNKVIHYYRMCRKETTSQISRQEVLTWQEAINRGAESILSNIKISGNLIIVDIKSVMHSPAYYMDNSFYQPAYELTLSGGGKFYISAISGKFLY